MIQTLVPGEYEVELRSGRLVGGTRPSMLCIQSLHCAPGVNSITGQYAAGTAGDFLPCKGGAVTMGLCFQVLGRGIRVLRWFIPERKSLIITHTSLTLTSGKFLYNKQPLAGALVISLV